MRRLAIVLLMILSFVTTGCGVGENMTEGGTDKQITTSAGDVMLYNSNQIAIFYGTNSWEYTRLGRVEDLSADELEEILSGSETEITLSAN